MFFSSPRFAFERGRMNEKVREIIRGKKSERKTWSRDWDWFGERVKLREKITGMAKGKRRSVDSFSADREWLIPRRKPHRWHEVENSSKAENEKVGGILPFSASQRECEKKMDMGRKAGKQGRKMYRERSGQGRRWKWTDRMTLINLSLSNFAQRCTD